MGITYLTKTSMLLQCLILGIVILVPTIQGVTICSNLPHLKCNCLPVNGTKLKCPRLSNIEELSRPDVIKEISNITLL